MKISHKLKSVDKTLYVCSRLLSSEFLSHATKLRIRKTVIQPCDVVSIQKVGKKIVCF